MVTAPNGSTYPHWMESVQKDGKITERVQPRGGGWRERVGASMEGGKLTLSLSHATERRPLFNGIDLTGWIPIGNVNSNKWMVENGELVNNNPPVEGKRGPGAANIRTLDEFQDFKLHLEALCPEHGNSGIYLRGRYEIQVSTEGGRLPDHEMGAT